MFTGIVDTTGRIVGIEKLDGNDLRVTIESEAVLDGLELGASVACSGVCLTVISFDAHRFAVDVSGETVSRTVPSMWEEERRINLERALRVGDELGGHIVTGHVDAVGTIVEADEVEGSLHLAVLAPSELAPAIAAKGSIAVDGVSLTVNAVEDRGGRPCFHLNIIPHTAERTTLGQVVAETPVNLEIDILARYLQRMLETRTIL